MNASNAIITVENSNVSTYIPALLEGNSVTSSWCKNEARDCKSSLRLSARSCPNDADETWNKPRQSCGNDDSCAVPTFNEFESVTFVAAAKPEDPLDPFSRARNSARMPVRVVHFLEDKVVERHNNGTRYWRILTRPVLAISIWVFEREDLSYSKDPETS